MQGTRCIEEMQRVSGFQRIGKIYEIKGIEENLEN